jgi:hypothetical protein
MEVQQPADLETQVPPAPKKPYETPEVTTHGAIEDMTQQVGPGSALLG